MRKTSPNKLNFKEVNPTPPINLDVVGQEKALQDDEKYPLYTTRLIRKLFSMIDADFTSVSIQDRDMLEEALSGTSLVDIARHRKLTCARIRQRVNNAFDFLGQKISGWEEQHQQLNELGEEIKKQQAEELARNKQIAEQTQCVKTLEVENSYLRSVMQALKEENKDQKEKVHDMEARLAELEPQLSQLQSELKTKNDELESLRQEKLLRTVEAHQYDNFYAQAQKIITRQSQEIERLKNRFASKLSNNDRQNQERIAKLKNRIYSLENLIQRYKEQVYGSR